MPNPIDSSAAFHEELLAITEDLMTRSLARRWAKDRDTAEDAIQEAYRAVAQMADPAAIVNLRAYFYQVLRRETYRLCGQLGAVVVDDSASLVDARQDRARCNAPAPRPLDEVVVSNLLIQGCLKAVADRKQELAAKVPGRSRDPNRYRDVIVAAAKRILHASLTGDISDADHNTTLYDAYPEWFAEPGYPENTYHQRFRRARTDTRALLKTVVTRDDLRSLAAII